MLTPCERMLVNEEAEARRAFAEHRPVPLYDANHVVSLSPDGLAENDPELEAWVRDGKLLMLRWRLAVGDIAAHVREHGEIEADRGTWMLNGHGRAIFVATNRETAA
jgi:hypothetical protein